MASFSWVELHGALTHVPVAFLLGVAAFEVGAWLFHKPEWRTVSFWMLVGAVTIAVPSLLSGWLTGGDLRFTGGAMVASAIFTTHRLFAFITSGLAILLLFWRVKVKDELAGRPLALSVLLSLLIAGCVSVTGYLGGHMALGETARPLGPPHVTIVNVPDVDQKTVAAGQKLFTQLPCQSCHRMEGKGGNSGPDLSHEAGRHAAIRWHIAHLKDPQSMTPNSDMPAFDTISQHDLQALAAYLATRK